MSQTRRRAAEDVRAAIGVKEFTVESSTSIREVLDSLSEMCRIADAAEVIQR